MFGLPSADRMAILALQELEDDTCPCGCGQPSSEAHDDDGPDYEAHTITCRAGEVLDRARKDAEPGELVYVVAQRVTDDDLAAERAAEAEALAALRRNRPVDPQEV